MTAKYYIRPRAEKNRKMWQGPFDETKLKELADRRLFSKELHEYSDDAGVNWISARQIWPILFPKRVVRTEAEPKPIEQSQLELRQPELVQPTVTVEETSEWYYSNSGAQVGPVAHSELQKVIQEGRLQLSDLVWCPQYGDQWVEAQSVPSLVPPKDSQSRQPTETNAPSGDKPPPLAITSFICGILGLICVPGLGSLLAVICGHIALSQYARPGASKNGKWMALTGLCLGYAMLALLLFSAMVFILVAIFQK